MSTLFDESVLHPARVVPANGYEVIMADPPWHYNSRRASASKFGGGACFHYDLMTDAELSARSGEVREQTETWLKEHGIWPDFFRMRDAGDHTLDRELKAQWLAEYGKDKVFCVFDDRSSVVAMWRAQGLPCFQVAPGEF